MNFTAEYQYTFDEYKEAMTYIRKSMTKQRVGPTGATRGLIGWIFFLGLAIMLYILLKQGAAPVPVGSSPPPIAPANPIFDVFLPFIPWVLVFGFVWFFIFRRLRGQSQKSWDQNPILDRVRTITITDAGLIQSDSVSEHRTSWMHYLRFMETPNLFLLFISNFSAELVPKRIFTNPGDLDQFRSLLERNISGPVAAFPVIPIATPSERI